MTISLIHSSKCLQYEEYLRFTAQGIYLTSSSRILRWYDNRKAGLIYCQCLLIDTVLKKPFKLSSFYFPYILPFFLSLSLIFFFLFLFFIFHKDSSYFHQFCSNAGKEISHLMPYECAQMWKCQTSVQKDTIQHLLQSNIHTFLNVLSHCLKVIWQDPYPTKCHRIQAKCWQILALLLISLSSFTVCMQTQLEDGGWFLYATKKGEG